MIFKEFYVSDPNLHYYIFINQIKINFENSIKSKKFLDEHQLLHYIIDFSEEVQKKYENTIVQFISDEYILNQTHIFNACYYTQKAFLHKINIAEKKNLELILYLSGKRQITQAIGAFGININSLKKEGLLFCVLSEHRNYIDEINKEILGKLNAIELKLNLEEISEIRLNKIKNFYDINDNQIRIVLNSYGLNSIDTNTKNFKLKDIILAINDLVCEKMAILSLEKI